jgi:hypothetical protein
VGGARVTGGPAGTALAVPAAVTATLAALATALTPVAARRAGAQPVVGPPLATLAIRPRTDAGRQARAAVRDFEFGRRRQLPEVAGGGSGRCDVQIGRICYWDNNGDPPLPPERPATMRARAALVERLARAAADDSTDDWTVGQHVRYRLELGDAAGADSAAAGCRGTPWWCQALVGLVRHATGDHVAAERAHDSARALLPDVAARCAWDDVSPWLPPDAARGYRRLACGSPERGRYEARFWRLAQPFWALAANDLRTELAARRTLARLHGTAPNPFGMPWGDDLAEGDVRYGAPVAWAARPAAMGSPGDRPITGDEPRPSYDFTPDGRTLAPARLLGRPLPGAVSGAGAWALARPVPQTRYAPRYTALGVRALDHQIARFRRGDTLVIVGAYAAPDTGPAGPTGAGDTPPVRPSAHRFAALVLDDSAGRPAAAARRDAAPATGALTLAVPAPGAPASAAPGAGTAPAWLAALEVLDTAAVPDTGRANRDGRDGVPANSRPQAPGRPRRGRAARARTPVAALPADAQLSDLLFVRPGDYGPAPALASVADSAAGAPVIRAGALFGLFWEQYPPAAARPRPTIAITATRVGTTVWQRLGTLVGRAVVAQPVSLRYQDPVAPGAGPGRYVALRWPVVPPGTYRLTVSVWNGRPPGDSAAGAAAAHDSAAAAADTARVASAAADSTTVDSGAVDTAASLATPAGAVAGTSVIVRIIR